MADIRCENKNRSIMEHSSTINVSPSIALGRQPEGGIGDIIVANLQGKQTVQPSAHSYRRLLPNA